MAKFKDTEIGKIPEEWDIEKLRDNCILVQYGYTQTATEKPIGPKFLRGTDIKGGIINWATVPYCRISEEDLQKYILTKGDIVITRMGTPGDSAIFEEELLAVFASYLIRVRLNQRFYPKFVYYFLQSKKYREYILGIVSTSATPGVNANGLTNILIPVPSLPEQRAIAKILSDLDAKIELNRQMNATLEKMAEALFKHWFVDFEFPNEEGKPYKSSGGKMVESELGAIPKGWKVGTLGDLAEVGSGKRPAQKSDNRTDIFSVELLGASSVMGYVQETLYSEPIIVTGRVGTHGIVQRMTKPSWPSDNTLVIKSRYYEYVFQCLKRIDYNSLNIGSTQPLITQTQIKNQDVLIPDDHTLEMFEKLVSNLYKKVASDNNEIEGLASIRDSLLPKLMSGKIRVGVN